MSDGIWIAALATALRYLSGVLRGRKGAWKVLPALLLAARAWGHPLFVAAFLLCAVGDALLLDKTRFFLAGLLAFLLGHLAFMAGFWPMTGPMPVGALVGYGGLAVVLLGVLMPRVRGVLRVAVPVYAAALVGLAVVAAAVSPLAGFGAAAFLLSDALLGWNRFRSPLPRGDFWILATYYGALLLLSKAAPAVS